MIILGLDPSQKTGWALYDTTQQKLNHIRAGVLRVNGTKGEFEANAGILGKELVKLIKDVGRPDFAALERAPRQPYGQQMPKNGMIKFMGQEIEAQGSEEGGGNGLQSTLSTNQMAAALSSVLGAFNVPFITMTDGAWRKGSYGFGRRKGWARADWKKHARTTCAAHKINVTNDDMAEACWIAYAAAGTQEFKNLERSVAA